MKLGACDDTSAERTRTRTREMIGNGQHRVGERWIRSRRRESEEQKEKQNKGRVNECKNNMVNGETAVNLLRWNDVPRKIATFSQF